MHYLGTHKEKSTVKIGQNVQAFYRIDNDNILKINFGHGANEGLNQHYTESFLKNICPIQEVFLSYSFSANVMANLEKIIGESNTKFAHFSGNGLEFLTKKIKQCCFLPNENKALKLIMQLDSFMDITRTHTFYGATYCPEMRYMLVDIYKTLITLALLKAQHEKIDLKFSDILNNEHLNGDNLIYYKKNIERTLLRFYIKEKEHLKNDNIKNFKGLTLNDANLYAKYVFTCLLNNEKIDGTKIPEEVKCGEFYNNLLLSCMIYDNTLCSKQIVSCDLKKELTLQIFDKANHLLPLYKKEKVQLVKQVLCSRLVVRSGAIIPDDFMIECSDNEEFNVFLMDLDCDYYKQIFPNIKDEAKQNPKLVAKMLNEIFTSRLDLYKFKKYMPEDAQKNEEISSLIQLKELDFPNKIIEKE